jgi:hypothetical protein
MGRVVLVHVAIIFGMGLVIWLDKPGSFFWVFGGLKTLSPTSAGSSPLKSGGATAGHGAGCRPLRRPPSGRRA